MLLLQRFDRRNRTQPSVSIPALSGVVSHRMGVGQRQSPSPAQPVRMIVCPAGTYPEGC